MGVRAGKVHGLVTVLPADPVVLALAGSEHLQHLARAPGSTERFELESRLKDMAAERIDMTMAIGGERRLGGGAPIDVVQPHRHAAVLGTLSDATTTDVKDAVAAAKAAAPAWRRAS